VAGVVCCAQREKGYSMTTARDVVTCDICKRGIDPLHTGMLFWVDKPDTLVVAHKRAGCQPHHVPRLLSAELWWFADYAAGVDQMVARARDYDWSVADLRRLFLLTWAIPLCATDADKAAAIDFARMHF
jgi:hypothetical protein